MALPTMEDRETHNAMPSFTSWLLHRHAASGAMDDRLLEIMSSNSHLFRFMAILIMSWVLFDMGMRLSLLMPNSDEYNAMQFYVPS